MIKHRHLVLLLAFTVLVFSGVLECRADADGSFGDGGSPEERYLFYTKKMAEKGKAKAQFLLADMYYSGEGISQDFTKAFKWYRKAAEQGNAKAQYNLGLMYSKGEATPVNYTFAYAWSSLAATQGHEKARRNRDIFGSKLTPPQLEKARELAAKIQDQVKRP